MCQIDSGGTRVLRKRNCRKPASSLVTQALTLACIRDRCCRCTNTSVTLCRASVSDRCVRVICRKDVGYRAFQNLMISSDDFVGKVFIIGKFLFLFPFIILLRAIWEWLESRVYNKWFRRLQYFFLYGYFYCQQRRLRTVNFKFFNNYY